MRTAPSVVKWVTSRISTRTQLLLIVLLAFLVRLPGLDRDLWYDESHALFSARGTDFASKIVPNGPEFTNELFHQDGGWKEFLLGVSHTDVNPPLYFVLLRLWIKAVGDNDWELRVLSVILGIFGILAMFFFGRAIFDEKIGLVAAAVLAILPTHIQYTQEIRPYALMMLLATLTSLVYWKASGAVGQRGEWRYWALYTILAAACLYTHYFTGGLLLAHGLFALLQPSARRTALLKRLAVVVPCLLLLNSPWYLSPYVREQWGPWLSLTHTAGLGSGKLSWQYVKPERLIGLLQDLVAGWLVGARVDSFAGLLPIALYVAIAMAVVPIARKSHQQPAFLFAFLLFLIPPIFVIPVAPIVNNFLPTHSPKYILCALTGLCPLVGATILASTRRELSLVAISLIILIAGRFHIKAAIAEGGTGHPAWYGHYGNISEAVARVEGIAKPDELILFGRSDAEELLQVWNVYQKSPSPQLVLRTTKFYNQAPLDLTSRWQQVEEKYQGIYLIAHTRVPTRDLARRLEATYQLEKTERIGRIEISHYLKGSPTGAAQESNR